MSISLEYVCLYSERTWRRKRLRHFKGTFGQHGTLIFRPDPPKRRKARKP